MLTVHFYMTHVILLMVTNGNMVSDPFSPLPGEVRFSPGDEAGQPGAMAWQYWEPRRLRKLHTLPVPLNITSQEDSPVDMMVRERG